MNRDDRSSASCGCGKLLAFISDDNQWPNLITAGRNHETECPLMITAGKKAA